MQKVCAVVWCYIGDADAADEAARAGAATEPLLHGVGAMPYPALQGAFDGLYPTGEQWYWRADFVDELPDEAIAEHVECGAKLPTMHSTMHLYPIDGAAHDVARRRTARGLPRRRAGPR